MSIGFKELNNLSISEANSSVKISDMSGDGGVGPSGFTLFGFAHDILPNNNAQSLSIFPSGEFVVGNGSATTLSVQKSFVNSGNDKQFDYAGGSITFTDGFWAASVRALLTGTVGLVDLEIEFGTDNPVLQYDQNITETPINPSNTTPSWNGSQGSTTISVDFDNSDVVNPTAIAIYRDNLPLASIPWVNGITTYEYTDTVFAPGIYVYTAVVYKYGSPNTVSDFSPSISVTFGGVPSLELEMSGGFDLGGIFVFSFVTDPSGIYKLVIGLRHDTLYNREDPLDITTVDVAIPNPFIDTFFAGK